jgi:hypothetical protein
MLAGSDRLGGDPLDLALALGLLCAIFGGGLSAVAPGHADEHGASVGRSLVICLGAATGVAIMLISLRAAGRADPYWATAIEHASTAVSAGALAVLVARVRPGPAGRRSGASRTLPERGTLPLIACAAVAGVGGDVAYVRTHGSGAPAVAEQPQPTP